MQTATMGTIGSQLILCQVSPHRAGPSRAGYPSPAAAVPDTHTRGTQSADESRCADPVGQASTHGEIGDIPDADIESEALDDRPRTETTTTTVAEVPLDQQEEIPDMDDIPDMSDDEEAGGELVEEAEDDAVVAVPAKR